MSLTVPYTIHPGRDPVIYSVLKTGAVCDTFDQTMVLDSV